MIGVRIDWKPLDTIIKQSNRVVIENHSYKGATSFYINWFNDKMLLHRTQFEHQNYIDRNRALGARILKEYEEFRDFFLSNSWLGKAIDEKSNEFIKRSSGGG